MPVDVGRVPPKTSVTEPHSGPRGLVDSGLVCVLIIARFYDLPADGSQLCHQFTESGKFFGDTELLRAAKHIGLKAGR